MKPHKYGLKIWVLADVHTSYAWRMQPYTGKPEAVPGHRSEREKNQRIVLDLTNGLSGQVVICDNFFTTYALGEALLKRKIGMVGTVRRNKPDLPPAIVNSAHQERELKSSVSAFTRTHLAVSYLPKRSKNVLLMSTAHREPTVSDRDDKKPQVALDYERAVDSLDKTCTIMHQNCYQTHMNLH